ncbi:carbonic anhydrase-like [Dreissena polymorpha]|uniref:carbonic anhydrase-like n=1 Tax=Dreissena polymorpha TaxID=45954 RepID=UPI002263AC4E|nr:carbonic anhydrase-like [Dreissena polymorpha]
MPVFIEAFSSVFQSGEENPVFSTVSDNLDGLIEPGSSVTTPCCLDSTDLFPAIDDYWKNEDSLTIPPLYESAQWILDALRRLIDSDGNPMQDNFRPAQQIKGRYVRASFK